MSGTKAGGLKAAETNRAKHGKDFYAEIGRKGGQNGHTGGFAANPKLARLAGAKGGRKSRRGPTKTTEPKPVIKPSEVKVTVEPDFEIEPEVTTERFFDKVKKLFR